MRQAKTFRSKKDFVYETLRDQILNGDLVPGTRLIIDDLASELGVSQIPVREALQQLQADRFVTIEPYIGARVAEIHEGLVHEVFELMQAMELISGRAACQKMTDADFLEMEGLVVRMDTNVDDLEQWSQDNVRLHQLICEKAEMSLVQDLLLHVQDHWQWLRRYYLEDVFALRIKKAQQDHWELLAALRTHDPNYVTNVISQHNQSALNDYLHYLDQLEQAEDSVDASKQHSTISS